MNCIMHITIPVHGGHFSRYPCAVVTTSALLWAKFNIGHLDIGIALHGGSELLFFSSNFQRSDAILSSLIQHDPEASECFLDRRSITISVAWVVTMLLRNSWALVERTM